MSANVTKTFVELYVSGVCFCKHRTLKIIRCWFEMSYNIFISDQYQEQPILVLPRDRCCHLTAGISREENQRHVRRCVHLLAGPDM